MFGGRRKIRERGRAQLEPDETTRWIFPAPVGRGHVMGHGATQACTDD